MTPISVFWKFYSTTVGYINTLTCPKVSMGP